VQLYLVSLVYVNFNIRLVEDVAAKVLEIFNTGDSGSGAKSNWNDSSPR